MARLSTVQQVIQSVAQAVATNNGQLLAAALTIDLGNSALLQQLASMPQSTLERLCAQALQVSARPPLFSPHP